MEKDVVYIDKLLYVHTWCFTYIRHRYVFLEKISAGIRFRNKKKSRYGIPAYTGPFRTLPVRKKIKFGQQL
jgi:hypothetical protein